MSNVATGAAQSWESKGMADIDITSAETASPWQGQWCHCPPGPLLIQSQVPKAPEDPYKLLKEFMDLPMPLAHVPEWQAFFKIG